MFILNICSNIRPEDKEVRCEMQKVKAFDAGQAGGGAYSRACLFTHKFPKQSANRNVVPEET